MTKVNFKFNIGNSVSLKYENSRYDKKVFTIVARHYEEHISMKIIRYEIFADLHNKVMVLEDMLEKPDSYCY